MGGLKAFIDGILNRGKKNKTPQSTAVGKPYSYTFKGKDAWEAAAGEYRRLTGKAEEAELTEEERKKIYDYTMTPIAYFFGWLCERDLIGEGFAGEFSETDKAKLPEEVKAGKITPIEALAGLDYYFSYEWIKEEVKYFFRSYFDARFCGDDNFTDKDVYLYDYYECNGEPEDRYYCLDYSAEVQKKIDRRLDEHYAKDGANRLSLEDLNDNYYSDEEDDENVMTLHSNFFDKDLLVLRCGEMRKGEFPDDYAQKCLRSLEEMPPKEWHRLERLLMGIYGGEPEDFKMDHFSAYCMYIYEPQEEGDLAFVIDGGADYEEEHGISFTIRNGILLGWGHSCEIVDPYDEELLARYEIYSYGRDSGTGTGEIDFEQIKEQKDLDALVKDGKLIRTLLVPEWLGGTDADENTVCVTPLTMAQIEKIHKRLKVLRTYAAIVYPDWKFQVDVEPEYCVNADGTKALVPMRITYSRPLRSKPVYIWMKAIVWE